MMRGVVLYGPPASGKDTVTSALSLVDSSYRIFRRLKVGPGRTVGYRMSQESIVDELRIRGGVVWENRRYDSLYVVDLPALHACLNDHVPVVHLGQAEAVEAVVQAVEGASWVVVSLWCPRDVAYERIVARGTDDTDARLNAWDATTPLRQPHLEIDTSKTRPSEAASKIHQRVNALRHATGRPNDQCRSR